MAQIETWVTQDLQKPVKVSYLDGNIFSADNDGNIVGVVVYNNGQPATLTGSVSGNIIRPDGVTVAAIGTLSGNTASIVLPQDAYLVPGVVSIIIKNTVGTQTATLAVLVANVYQSSTDTIVDPGTILPSIADLIAAIDEAVSSIPADYSELLAEIAPDYSTSNTYNVGEYVWYDGGLYRCVSAISSGESWTAAHWESITICDDIWRMANAISNIRTPAGKNVFNHENLAVGKSINSSGNLVVAASATSTSTTDYMPIEAETHYIVSNDGENYWFLVVAFYDSSKQFISRVTSGINNFTTPSNTAYYRVTKDGAIPETVQVEFGSTRTPFEPYWKVNSKHLGIDGTQIKNNTISAEKINTDFVNDILEPLFPKIVVEAQETENAYYNWYPATNSIGGPTSILDFVLKTYKVTDRLPFYFTGTVRGSARVIMATYLDENKNPIGFNGIYSSSTAVDYVDYPVGVIEGAAYVAFCSYGDSTIKKLKNTVFPASENRFIGHNALPKFDTDYAQIIVYGQSLSNGSDSLYVTDPALPECYMLGTLTSPSATLNPLTVTSGNEHPVISTVNCLHDLIWNNTGSRPALIAGSYGAGGQSIAQLMSSTRQTEIKAEEGYTYNIETSGKYQVFLNSLTYAKQVADTNGKTISCPVIFFLQGERDYYSDEELSDLQPGSAVHAYACGDDKDKYKLYMKRLKDDMQAACVSAYGQTVKPLFAIYEVSGKFVKKHDMGINMAQIEFAEENDDVILLPTPYFVPDYSSGHLATNGYRWFGEYMAEAAFQTLAQRSDFAPMIATDPTIDGNNIRLKVRNAYLPMKIDTYTVEQASGYGFAIWADDNRCVLNGVKIFGDEIILKTGTNLETATTVELSYGGMEVNGTGNIRDSSPFVAKYTYWDDTDDHGSSGTLTISHIPEDADGNRIYGQKYPMWNWLSSFYKQIK